tara:strand:+ start:2803 stop:4767 length:1965 start_codon:yes stop_codon:yes gene_type:complete
MANKSVGFLTVAFGADMRGFDKAMKKAQRSIKKFGVSMQRTGENLTTSITLPTIALGVAAVKMASDYDEALNKVKVSFGDASVFVEKFAKTTLDSFGIAEGSALDMAALFGDMGTSIGLSENEAAKMSTTLVGLVGDLASFKNIRHDIAQTALASVFTGETESLKKLGVIMTQANLQQFALEQGITKSIKAMTEAEKVQLRFLFVLARTANAQGDYANTSQGVANSIRDLQQRFQELGQQIGEIITPFATKLIAKLKELIDRFRNLSTEQKESIIKFAAIAATLGPLLIVIGKMSIGIVAVANAIGMTTKALGLLRVALLAHPITALITALSAGVLLLIANLGQMDIATKKTKNLTDDLIKTKERLAKLNEDELKTEKAKLELQMQTINSQLKSAKAKADEMASKLNVGTATMLGPDMGDSGGEGRSAAAFQLQAQTDKVTELQNQYNNLAKTLKLINSTLKDQSVVLEETGTTVEETGEKWETYYAFIEEGSSQASQAQERLSKVMDFFSDTLQGAMVSAAHSQEGFFQALFKNIKQAIKSLLIQLAVMTAIALIFGKADSVAAAFKLATTKFFNFDSTVPFAEGGLVTGPVNALIGEGAGTSASNPEVVAPLDRLRSMINGGTQQVEVYGRISGNDIFISNQRGGLNRQRAV